MQQSPKHILYWPNLCVQMRFLFQRCIKRERQMVFNIKFSYLKVLKLYAVKLHRLNNSTCATLGFSLLARSARLNSSQLFTDLDSFHSFIWEDAEQDARKRWHHMRRALRAKNLCFIHVSRGLSPLPGQSQRMWFEESSVYRADSLFPVRQFLVFITQDNCRHKW